ncbi:MAG: aspartate/glutamate racemase family protein [Acetobacteraceae bacterium]|nr:arylsulfatase [Pseudomonadota bacterium]
MRITLIHALTHSIAPTANAFSRLWPEATLMNLLDDSLSVDLARDGALTPAMTERFLALARYAASTGAQGILFTCSAFGPCIEACARELAPMPVLKPNEAMIEDAVALAGPTGRIGLLATFPPTLQSMPPEFHHAGGAGISVEPCLAEGALAALDRGDTAGHDAAAVKAVHALIGCDVIALSQFSLARAAPLIEKATGSRVLTTPDSAVRKLKRLLLSPRVAA